MSVCHGPDSGTTGTVTPPPGVGLAIGPANYAGQAHQWARAAQRVLGVPAVSFAFSDRLPVLRSGTFGFPVDCRLRHPRLSTRWGRAAQLRRVLRDTTHLAVDGFLAVYHRAGRGISLDFGRLRREGFQVALVAHGTEIRDPEHHLARYDYSYYRDAPADWVRQVGQRARRNRSFAAQCGAPLFVSTPDLLLDVDGATWLPVSIDPAGWVTRRPALRTTVPTVLHRPTRTVPPIKGTRVIDPILRALDAQGRIRYLAPEVVPHHTMPRLVAEADIVVDQILTGSYGVTAVEAMAAGRLVIGNVAADTVAVMPEEPPIRNATPETFAAVLAEILADPSAYAGQAAAGPGFVRRWHDGTAAAGALRPFLLA
ncbi:hypothetical protein [Micromonospora cathayae]|uniref:Uncharacterized protein n=1 Tax=Micromonospora cathayae TaxID=3028804 RepID=A0ABY7ZY89_9ACTN|nr:hypothetical protein [Micromonospora sp. HUAS 3]WDZ87870.1 hypothetical protein PVK37_16395 [Micromonospora sp. HUAS 3]